jgi:hypothetical protein
MMNENAKALQVHCQKGRPLLSLTQSRICFFDLLQVLDEKRLVFWVSSLAVSLRAGHASNFLSKKVKRQQLGKTLHLKGYRGSSWPASSGSTWNGLLAAFFGSGRLRSGPSGPNSFIYRAMLHSR